MTELHTPSTSRPTTDLDAVGWIPIVARFCCAAIVWITRIVAGTFGVFFWLPMIDLAAIGVQLWANEPLRRKYGVTFGDVSSLTSVLYSAVLIAIWLLLKDVFRIVAS